MKLNRRSFFKSIGSAILGTAIALRLGDSLIPNISLPELNKVPIPTFEQLNKMYEEAKKYGEEPKYFIFSIDMLNAIDEERLKPYCIKTEEQILFGRSIKFRNAEMLGSPMFSDEEVHCGGGGNKYGSQSRLNLLADKII